MKIEVLLSSYNGEKYIAEQLDSILAQNFHDLEETELEILIRDDGSSDGTKNILNEYSNVHRNITWYTGKNMGPGKSFWDLVKNAPSADFYCFADQDDVWKSDKIENGVRHLLSEGTPEKPLLYCSAVTVTDSNLKPLGFSITPATISTSAARALIYSLAPGCTYVFNNAARNEYIKYDEDKEFYQIHDWLAFRITALMGKVIFDNESHMFYRQHGDNAVGAAPGHAGLHSAMMKIRSFARSKACLRSNSARSLLHVYGDELSAENKRLVHLIADYKDDPAVKRELLREPAFKIGTKNDFFFKMLVKMGRV